MSYELIVNSTISSHKFVNREAEVVSVPLIYNTKIKKNNYNIPEPIDGIEVPHSKLEVVFIPLLAFDKKGNRVGYGKGFYDNMLNKCTPNCIKVGVSFFEATKTLIEDSFAGDIPLDYCVTPKKIYSFKEIQNQL